MNKLLLCVLCVLALFTAVAPCLADTVNGVLAEERVVSLPNDQGKWYISVVGDTNDARYKEILGWFESSASLANLKSHVHFCPVTANTAIYTERYASNVKGLPTVRMQKPDGTVVYEAAGNDIPMTAGGLNGALAAAVNAIRGLRPVLPWRRDADNRLKNLERPKPQPQPDPEPQPIDDSGMPDMETEVDLPEWMAAPVCCLGLLVGLGWGYGKKLKEKLLPAAQ
jgi:hypothetical protein